MSPIHENENSDAPEVLSRLLAWLQEHGIEVDSLADRTGLSPDLVARLLDQGSDGMDSNSGVLDQVIAACHVDRDYVLSGTHSQFVNAQESRRMQLRSLIERLCRAADLRAVEARSFAVFAMQECEPLLCRLQVGHHNATFPETVEELLPVYMEWQRQFQRGQQR